MMYFLVFLHVLVCIAMIAIVLLQSGKGAEMGASFGTGGSQSVFGASGGNTFMSKLTTGSAIIFMLTSLTLAYQSGATGGSSIMSSKAAQKAAPPAKPAAPAQQAPAQPQQAAPVKPAMPQGAPTQPAQQVPAAPVNK
jgi:preprotein translocase subunit SecG